MSATAYAMRSSDLESYLRSIRDDAVRGHRIPESLADSAAEITRRRFEPEFHSGIDDRAKNRIKAYFRGVVRHRVMASRGPELREVQSQFILFSLAADLKGAGRSGLDIYQELAREYAPFVAPTALEALKSALCGSAT